MEFVIIDIEEDKKDTFYFGETISNNWVSTDFDIFKAMKINERFSISLTIQGMTSLIPK